MILLDTDVMVDILRGYEPAKEWLKTAQEIGIPGLVADDCNRALTSFASHHLSDKIGLLDALIAKTAIGVNAELATFNVKHYRVLKGLRSVQPYAK